MRIHLISAAVLASAPSLFPAAPALAQPSTSLSPPAEVFSGKRSREVLIAQVLLDRSRHSPGVVDGHMGGNTARAIRAYQRANGMAVDGKISQQLLRRLASNDSGNILQRYTLTSDDVSGPFVAVPTGMAAMAELDRVGYENPGEKIAEKSTWESAFSERSTRPPTSAAPAPKSSSSSRAAKASSAPLPASRSTSR